MSVSYSVNGHKIDQEALKKIEITKKDYIENIEYLKRVISEQVFSCKKIPV